jgi:hypothetical protein
MGFLLIKKSIHLIYLSISQLKYKRYEVPEDSLHLYIQIIEVLLNKNTMENKLKIQIWSDIMSICYIGKRRTLSNNLSTKLPRNRVEKFPTGCQLRCVGR